VWAAERDAAIKQLDVDASKWAAEAVLQQEQDKT